MADDDVARQLNEAVLPSKFSLEAIKKAEAEEAATRLSQEGNLNIVVPNPDTKSALDRDAMHLQPAPDFRAVVREGRLRLAGDENAQFGISFRSKDNIKLPETNMPAPHTKGGPGLYLKFKF